MRPTQVFPAIIVWPFRLFGVQDNLYLKISNFRGSLIMNLDVHVMPGDTKLNGESNYCDPLMTLPPVLRRLNKALALFSIISTLKLITKKSLIHLVCKPVRTPDRFRERERKRGDLIKLSPSDSHAKILEGEKKEKDDYLERNLGLFLVS